MSLTSYLNLRFLRAAVLTAAAVAAVPLCPAQTDTVTVLPGKTSLQDFRELALSNNKQIGRAHV